MKFYNIIDDKGRFLELKVTFEKSGQVDSHTVSYMYARGIYQQMGQVMGLETLINLYPSINPYYNPKH